MDEVVLVGVRWRVDVEIVYVSALGGEELRSR